MIPIYFYSCLDDDDKGFVSFYGNYKIKLR